MAFPLNQDEMQAQASSSLPRSNREAASPAAISLRPVTRGDQDFILSVYASTRQTELALIDWTPEQKMDFVVHQNQAQQRHYQAHFPHSEHSLIIWHDQGQEKAAGRLWVDSTPTELHLLDIALLPEFCGLGIGTILMRRLMDAGSATDLPLRLYVEKFNHGAIRFYRRLGFVTRSETGLHFELVWPAAKD